MTPPARRLTGLAAASLALLIAGSALYWFAAPEEYGWFAYAPLSEEMPPPPPPVSPLRLVGLAAAALGVFGFGMVAGVVLARRASRP